MMKLARVIALLGAANVAAFVLGTVLLGGDALNAKAVCPPGDYLYDKTLREPCHNVPHTVYVYSRLHAYSAIPSALAAVIAGLGLAYSRVAARVDAEAAGRHRSLDN